tara:strand:- start:262 stop:435 length:174 start_codon:yes stop_codon:yes gene_type:complete
MIWYNILYIFMGFFRKIKENIASCLVFVLVVAFLVAIISIEKRLATIEELLLILEIS